MFETLEIKARVKKTKTGQYPTGEEVLEKIKEHPIVPAVLRYRKLKKLKSTYVDPLPKLVNAQSGRVHTTYQQTVAATGRLSSKDPNLQNIPIRTEEGQAIRKAFIPRDDNHVLLAADYSQVELRIAAALSKDPGLVDAFVQGHDVHTATAAKVFQVEPEAVDRGMRSKAKAVNFGILYGQGAFGLAQNLGIPRREAKEIIDAYFVEFAQLKAFTADCVDRVRETGYAETVLGRRRYLPDIASNNATVRAFAERNAVNAPIQGSGSGHHQSRHGAHAGALNEHQLNARMIMQVHDELVFDVPVDEVAQLEGLIEAAWPMPSRWLCPSWWTCRPAKLARSPLISEKLLCTTRCVELFDWFPYRCRVRSILTSIPRLQSCVLINESKPFLSSSDWAHF